MDVTDVWVGNEEGSEIVRARDIAGASLDYDGNVTVRLTGGDSAVVIAGHRTHQEENRPGRLSPPADPRGRRTVGRGRRLPGAPGPPRGARLAVGQRAALATLPADRAMAAVPLVPAARPG